MNILFNSRPLLRKKLRCMPAKLNSIFNHKCPQCLEGDIFQTKSSYNLKSIAKMNHSCPKCGLDFEREPGYYYGAMYVSYALTVAVGVILFLADMVLFTEFSTSRYLVSLTLLLLLLSPLTFRTARVIWLNLFVKYKPDVKK